MVQKSQKWPKTQIKGSCLNLWIALIGKPNGFNWILDTMTKWAQVWPHCKVIGSGLQISRRLTSWAEHTWLSVCSSVVQMVSVALSEQKVVGSIPDNRRPFTPPAPCKKTVFACLATNVKQATFPFTFYSPVSQYGDQCSTHLYPSMVTSVVLTCIPVWWPGWQEVQRLTASIQCTI